MSFPLLEALEWEAHLCRVGAPAAGLHREYLTHSDTTEALCPIAIGEVSGEAGRAQPDTVRERRYRCWQPRCRFGIRPRQGFSIRSCCERIPILGVLRPLHSSSSRPG